jgi:hypothetical protein
MEEGPSPYVGQVDLENGLANPDDGQRAKRKLQSRYQDRKDLAEEDSVVQDSPADLSEGDGASKPTKSKRRSRSPKAPPGGRYRIPEKGQLQIIIKNQNKTAVKLYLVPYDLAGMEPGTKTFIRQRSYSAGPIIEADSIPDAKDTPAGVADRPTLRYLIHLHICSPSKGRYYLYKSIRVVFANRVPDGKERLRNEVTYPDPRFTPYKPTRVMHPPVGVTPNISPSAAALTAEQAFRRRSVGFSFPNAPSASLHHHHHHQHHHRPFHLPESQHNNAPQTAIPAPITTFATGTGTENEISKHEIEQVTQIPNTTTTTTTKTSDMPDIEMTGSSSTLPNHGSYDKLSKGDVGYGTPSATAEGLLSKRLRSLGVQRPELDENTWDM